MPPKQRTKAHVNILDFI